MALAVGVGVAFAVAAVIAGHKRRLNDYRGDWAVIGARRVALLLDAIWDGAFEGVVSDHAVTELVWVVPKL